MTWTRRRYTEFSGRRKARPSASFLRVSSMTFASCAPVAYSFSSGSSGLTGAVFALNRASQNASYRSVINTATSLAAVVDVVDFAVEARVVVVVPAGTADLSDDEHAPS